METSQGEGNRFPPLNDSSQSPVKPAFSIYCDAMLLSQELICSNEWHSG